VATHKDGFVGAEFSRDGLRVVTTSLDNVARVWETPRSNLVVTLEGHTDTVNSAKFSPDGKNVVTASSDRTARVWDAQTGRLIRSFSEVYPVISADFGPDGNLVTTVTAGRHRGLGIINGTFVRELLNSADQRRLVDPTVRIWSVKSGSVEVVLSGHSDVITSARFSPDGKYVVTASEDNTARIWVTETGYCLAVLLGHSRDVYSAVFSPEETRVVTASDDHTARVWEVDTGQIVPASLLKPSRTLHGFHDTLESPGGAFSISFDLDKFKIIEKRTGNCVIPAVSHHGAILAAAFSSDEKYLVTASEDNTAMLWDSRTGRNILILRGHTDHVTDAAFSPDAQWLVTTGKDMTTRVWQMATGKEVAEFPSYSDSRAEFSSDGKSILVARAGRAEAQSFACEVCGPYEDLVASARTHVTRDLTAEEREMYLHEHRKK
jgi:WD40 repeat protein